MKNISSFLTVLFTFLSFLLFGQATTENSRGLVVKQTNQLDKSVQSKKYALVIGSDRYDGKPMWSDLKNAEYDAKSMKEILEVKYNFETEILLSPTKNEALKSIISYHQKLKSSDRFLVFIAGHGDYDKSIYDDGFLVFKDSKPYTEDFARSTYLGYHQLNAILNALPSKHVGLILDVCFGGTFNTKVATYRSANKVYEGKSSQSYANQKLAKTSRLFLTSGALEPVPDGYEEKHSPFCYILLDALESGDPNGLPITLSWLHQQAQLNITESMYGFFGNNQPGSEFIIGGIKSQDNSTLVNKLLEEKELKEKAERREREAKSLLLTQDAIKAYDNKNYTKAFKKIIASSHLDSTNYSTHELYYKMLLEQDSFYLEEILSEAPIPLEEVEIMESESLDIKINSILKVDFQKRIIIAQQDTKILKLDFYGKILSSYQTKLKEYEPIWNIYFLEDKIFIELQGKLIAFDDNLKKIGNYDVPKNYRLNDISKDESTVLFYDSLNDNYKYYHNDKLITEIKEAPNDYIERIYIDSNNHLKIKTLYQGLYKYETYNTTGKEIESDNIQQFKSKYYKTYYGSVINTITEKEVFSSEEMDEYNFNYDSILDDVFHLAIEEEDILLIKDKIRLKNISGIIESKYQPNHLNIVNDSPYPLDFLLLNENTVAIAHKNDICIKTIDNQDILLRKQTQDFVKMIKSPNDDTFYVLTGNIITHYNSNGDEIKSIRLPEVGLDFKISPKGNTIAIFYKYFFISTLDENLTFKNAFIQTDPLWYRDNELQKARRQIEFINEEQFLVFGVKNYDSTFGQLENRIRLYNTKGDLIKIFDEKILKDYSSTYNSLEKVDGNNFILSTFINNDSSNYVFEIDNKGNILHDFGKWDLYKDDESYIHANLYKLDSSSFIIVNNLTKKIIQKNNNQWVEIDSIKVIPPSMSWYDSTFITQTSTLSIKPEYDYKYPLLPCDILYNGDLSLYTFNKIKKHLFKPKENIIEFMMYDIDLNYTYLNKKTSITNKENTLEYTFINTQSEDNNPYLSFNNDSKINKFDTTEKNLFTLSNKLKKHFNYKPININKFFVIRDVINDSLISITNKSWEVSTYNIHNNDSIEMNLLNTTIENNISYYNEVINPSDEEGSVFFSLGIYNLQNHKRLSLGDKYKDPIFRNIDDDHFFIYEKDSILDVYNSENLQLIFSCSLRDSIFQKIKNYHLQVKFPQPNWINEYELHLYKKNDNYYFRYYDVLFTIDFEKKSLLPEITTIELHNNKNYYIEKINSNTLKLYRLQNKKISDFVTEIKDWEYHIEDTTIAEIKLPFTQKEDELEVLYYDDKYFVVSNQENTFFFQMQQNEFSLQFLNKVNAIDYIKYIKDKNVFIGYKNNSIYTFDNQGQETINLSLNRDVLLADIYKDKLRVICGKFSDNNSTISIHEPSVLYEIPYFNNWLNNIDDIIRN
ncbi:caspase family protein [Flammeovirga sp. SubArs3]|uniref:caspase family protein n=1 Tax=Flammeovirga sp. SubArs3 TaxID=2995316 RepID=UPI00248BF5D8|nr:caspase family protein [Flammeovirga sp. SubArs3]